MTNRFGFQVVVMIGGLLISSGTIATSFTSSINQIYITYGLIAGIKLVTYSLICPFKIYMIIICSLTMLPGKICLFNSAGLGYSLTFLPTVTILSQYFNRRRPLVTALASTGESLSMFALAPGESKSGH